MCGDNDDYDDDDDDAGVSGVQVQNTNAKERKKLINILHIARANKQNDEIIKYINSAHKCRAKNKNSSDRHKNPFDN